MNGPKSTYRSFIWQHRLISFFRNIDFPGFRRLSLLLPKWLLPKAEHIGDIILALPSGLKLWINPSKDQGVERSLFETGTYEKGTLKFMRDHLSMGNTFVDIGANIGLMSITAKQAVGENGKVWAFEANPSTFDILEKNIALNELSGMHSFACGLGEKRETKTLYDNWEINRGAASTVVKSHNAKGTEITVLTLDEVVLGQNIAVDMIKIDVEGMEWEVLTGAEKTIHTYQPILIVEFSGERSGSKSRQELYQKIIGFEVYTLYKLSSGKERTSRLIKIDGFSDLPTDDNVFCLPQK